MWHARANRVGAKKWKLFSSSFLKDEKNRKSRTRYRVHASYCGIESKSHLTARTTVRYRAWLDTTVCCIASASGWRGVGSILKPETRGWRAQYQLYSGNVQIVHHLMKYFIFTWAPHQCRVLFCENMLIKICEAFLFCLWTHVIWKKVCKATVKLCCCRKCAVILLHEIL